MPRHADADLGRPFGRATDSASEVGILDDQAKDDGFSNPFAWLRDAEVIP